MTSPPVAITPEIIEYYEDRHDEAERLSSTADGVLEMVRTQELLRRHLPPAPAAVLDVGGGTGAHARWLTEDGYTVHLVDPVQKHLDQAAATGCTVELGDARALTAEDASYDVVLMLGPLYHLLERDDRQMALAEAHRVTRPGGLVAAAAISRYASLFENTAMTYLAAERVQTAVEKILDTGRLAGTTKVFTTAYFHTAAALEEEIRAVGLADIKIYSVEGPSWSLLKAAEQHSGDSLIDSPMFAAALASARLADSYPDLLAAASHLLATARAA
jgi:ubiquinone/menaquinone biosynthesis C-methylase UbiE